MKKKSLALLLSLVLVIAVVAGSSLAWLTATFEKPVINTFFDSDINIELTETTGEDYKMIPGWMIEKDPVVTVKEGSEDCWVFIKVEESETPKLDDYIEYEIDPNNWEQLKNGETPVEGIYVGTVPCKDIDADRSIKILLNNQVTVKGSVTKEMMDAIDEGAEQPKLTFTAYASQYWKNNTESFGAYEAWLNISDANANGTPDSEEVNP